MFQTFLIFVFFCFSIPAFGSDLIEAMSIEEKVGQLLMVHFHGELANEDAKFLVQEIKVGGIIYYNWSNGLRSPKQVQILSAGLQKLAEANPTAIPLFIAVDQEGGEVNRLNEGFTRFPGNKALGMTGDPTLAEVAALAMGQELHAVGVNMNLAPVVDINCNPFNPVIGVRSFGEHPEIVLAFGEKALNGYKQAEIIATLKHFPGSGDIAQDPHEDLPVVHKSKDELERNELLPFAKFASFADAIMTSHILVPALDVENCSTLSEKTLTYLKESIGFQGMIVSDSLVMAGAMKKCHTVDEAAIQALKAGCDLLLLGGMRFFEDGSGFELTAADIQQIHRSIVDAVKNGRVSEARLNQAVEKNLALKKRYLNLKADDIQSIDTTKVVNTPAHRAIARTIASLALRMIKNDSSSISPLCEKKICVFAPQSLSDSVVQKSLLAMGKSTEVYFFETFDLNVLRRAEKADVLLVCANNAWKKSSQAKLIQLLLGMEKPSILLVLGDPLDSSLFPKANLIFCTFSSSPFSIEIVCDQLSGTF